MSKHSAPHTPHFSLVETLVTLTILGTLATVVIPAYLSHQRQTAQTAAVTAGEAWAATVTDLTRGYTDYGSAAGSSIAVTRDGTMAVALVTPSPAVPAGLTRTVNNNGSIITSSSLSGLGWCFTVSNDGQVATFTQAGYQPAQTQCTRPPIAVGR